MTPLESYHLGKAVAYKKYLEENNYEKNGNNKKIKRHHP